MEIEVTQQDINKGIKGDICNCPIALALKRNGFKNVEVNGSDADFNVMPDIFVSLPLPKKAQTFVTKFDEEGKEAVKPFGFNLAVRF